MDRFVIACSIFSFITGMYVAHMVVEEKGCTITFVQGKQTQVFMGHHEY